jgi:hypothetical protein
VSVYGENAMKKKQVSFWRKELKMGVCFVMKQKVVNYQSVKQMTTLCTLGKVLADRHLKM